MGSGYGDSAGGNACGIELDGGNFAVGRSACEPFTGPAVVQAEVEHDAVVGGIGSVPVGFPVTDIEVEFDAAASLGSIDFDDAVPEVRAGSMIPPSELDDADWFAAGCDEFAAEVTGEPAALPCEFAAWQDAFVFREEFRFLQAGGAGGDLHN